MLREPREICAAGDGSRITVEMTLRGKKLKLLIDCGATGNYISPRTVSRINIPFKSITPYSLEVVDGTKINYQEGVIDQGTIPSKLVTPDGHTSFVQFDIALIGKHEAILGMPWIKEHNPEIDWNAGTVQFSRCNYKGLQL